MYDRTVKPIPEPSTTGLRYRIETLIGITGWNMSKYRISWAESIWSPFKVVWRPHLLMILVFEVSNPVSFNGDDWLRTAIGDAIRLQHRD